MAQQPDKSDDSMLRPVVKIKASPVHISNSYYFRISPSFIANSVLVPDRSYYLFVTEEVSKNLLGDSKSSPPYVDEAMFKPVVQFSSVPKTSHNQYYFKIDQDFITRAELIPDEEYNLFVFQSETGGVENKIESRSLSPMEFDAKCFMPVLRIITTIRKDRLIFTFPIPAAFIENENILPDHRYWIYVTKSIEKAKPHAKASKKKGSPSQK